MDRFTEKVVNAYRAKALLYVAERGLLGVHGKPIYWNGSTANAVDEKNLAVMLLDTDKIVGYARGRLPDKVVADFAEKELGVKPEEATEVYTHQEIVRESIGKDYLLEFMLGFVGKQMRNVRREIRDFVPDDALDVYALQLAEEKLTSEKGYDKTDDQECGPGYSKLVHMKITQTGKDSSLSIISVPPHPPSTRPGRTDITRIGYGKSRSQHKDFTRESLAAFARHTLPVAQSNLTKAKDILLSEEFKNFGRDLNHSAVILGLD